MGNILYIIDHESDNMKMKKVTLKKAPNFKLKLKPVPFFKLNEKKVSKRWRVKKKK